MKHTKLNLIEQLKETSNERKDTLRLQLKQRDFGLLDSKLLLPED